MGVEAVMGGLIYVAYSGHQSATADYNNYQSLYQAESDINLMMEYKQNRNNSRNDIKTAVTQITILAGITGTVWIANAVHAYMNGPGSEKKKIEKKEQKDEPEIIEQSLSKVDIGLAYEPSLQQTQIKFSIPIN